LLDRFAQFAVIAAREAFADAGITNPDDETAIFTGACVGGQTSEDEQFRRMYADGSPRVHPLTIPKVMANAGASAIAEEFGIHGPAMTISTACSSSAHALAMAYQMVRSGAVPMALAGGSEAVFSLGFLRSWEAMRVLSTDTCRPFSADRKGLILGEGGAMLVLEPLEAAQARGATIYAEMVGAGMSADAHHITQPSSEGAALAIRRALKSATLEPEAIGYINAHGTGTTTNDSTECAAIHSVFGPHAERLAISSTKSMHGHTLGAAGALEACATVLALKHGLLPPTANYTSADPACALDVIPLHARAVQVRAALSNSFAFGGLNAVLAFQRVD
jgi:nodulation protein E